MDSLENQDGFRHHPSSSRRAARPAASRRPFHPEMATV